MVKLEWEHLFRDKILLRGNIYYKNDTIKSFRKIDNTIIADVIGNDLYHVEITFEDGEISSMFCDCPYYDNCKHMVAVLQYLMNDKTDVLNSIINYKSKVFEKEDIDDIKGLVDSVDDDKLKNFLLDELNKDYDLFRRFKLIFKEDFTDIDKQYYYDTLSDIFFNGFDSIDLKIFIKNDIKNLLNRGEYDFICELSFKIFEYIDKIDVYDDEYYNYGYDIDELLELSLSILYDLFNSDYKNNLFERLIDYIKENDNFVSFYILTTLLISYEEKEYLEVKLNLCDEIITRNPNDLSFWINFKTDIMKELGKSNNELKSFRKDYLNLKEVIDYDIKDAINNKNYEIAVELLESIQNKIYFNHHYSIKLNLLYKKVGNDEKYQTGLKDLLFNCNIIDKLEYYKRYKSTYSKEEWLVEREEIFNYFKLYPYYLKSFYNEEGLYDRLFEEVSSSEFIRDYNEYLDVLKEDYSEELLSFYHSHVLSMAYSSGRRKKYRDIVSVLRIMETIPGGETVVKSTVADFKIKYKNRKAMMEELSYL